MLGSSSRISFFTLICCSLCLGVCCASRVLAKVLQQPFWSPRLKIMATVLALNSQLLKISRKFHLSLFGAGAGQPPESTLTQLAFLGLERTSLIPDTPYPYPNFYSHSPHWEKVKWRFTARPKVGPAKRASHNVKRTCTRSIHRLNV